MTHPAAIALVEPCVTTPNLKRIWLAPPCDDLASEGRTWCNTPQDPCEVCGADWVAYDIAEIRKPEREA